ncbi:McrB family protein [Paenibacillus sp. V4I5]|uniref:McrB family protein n=1 Tax=Paenibacillus sp. V4I5 TaxID=3042306 RepID=UPI0027921EEB|nr:hypothetical protein [Paenibacillus sp. V4I5]MDQ0917560.1 hypothetical protein [Paenibacillus sp. V4I5]
MKLIQEIDKMTEAKLKKAVFVGRLVTEDELANTLIESPVMFQDESNEFIIFNIRCLSDLPDDLSKYFLYHNKIFRGSTRSHVNMQKIKSLIPNFERLLPIDRKKRLGEILENKIVMFSLSQMNMYVYLDIVKIENIEPKESYYLIPQPNLPMNQSREDLEKRIIEGQPISLDLYPNIFQDPEFIYFDGYLYSNISFKHANVPTTYYVSNPEAVRRIQVSHTFFENIDSRIDSNLLIADGRQILDLRDELEEEGRNLWDVFQTEKEQALSKSKNSTPIEEVKPLKNHVEQSVKEYGFHENEIFFLEQLEQNAQTRGLYYDSNDLYNFHISTKTNLLTIIGGMTGTGKSQLARLFGETLGLTLGKNMIMIPISPAYHEPNDILGYLNTTNGVYHESETGLVSLLIEASKNPNDIYMVIFDEMNLSQVEHWFSPFISLLEVESNKRELSLYNSSSYCVNEKYKSSVHVGDNIIFVGTVNFDETTKSFSDRLLDRANIIVPRKLSFKEVRERQVINDITIPIQPFTIDTLTFREEWIITKQGELEHLTLPEIDLLDMIHDLMQIHDPQRGISFRVARNIAKFVANIPIQNNGKAIIPRETAFDLQLKQRILTKISGSETVLSGLVGSYLGDQYQAGEIVNVLQSAEAQQVSNFKHSIETIKQKAKELMAHGYTN